MFSPHISAAVAEARSHDLQAAAEVRRQARLARPVFVAERAARRRRRVRRNAESIAGAWRLGSSVVRVITRSAGHITRTAATPASAEVDV